MVMGVLESIDASGLPLGKKEDALSPRSSRSIGSSQSTPRLCRPVSTTKTLESPEVPGMSPPSKVSALFKNAVASPLCKNTSKVLYCTMERPPKPFKDSIKTPMPSVPLDAAATALFQAWVALLSPIFVISFVFHATGLVELQDCTSNSKCTLRS